MTIRIGTRAAVITCLAALFLAACSGSGAGEQAAPDGGQGSDNAAKGAANGSGGRGSAGSGGTHAATGSGGAHSTTGSGGSQSAAGGADHDAGPKGPVTALPFKCEVAPNDVIDKLDLLFAVDNSNSMREEQAGLSAQFAHMVDVLTSGDRDGDGVADFPAVNDLHLGVVTSDMGLANVQGIPGCTPLGQDGILQHAPASTLADCEASYPTFLSYAADKDDAAKAARDLGCIATVGTGGCGFEQQLEAPLKALWPSLDPMPDPDGTNRILFVGDGQGNGTFAHGDTDNLGFLRNDPSEGLSLIAVVVVTDEEDCSSSSTKHFTPPTMLAPDDPLINQPLNLRCYYNEMNNGGDELFKIQRYVTGFQALRSGNEDLVVFAAIAGVPPDLVDRAQLDKVDFADAEMRDVFYSAILRDQRMQEAVDPDSMTTPGTGNLLPSCNSDSGKAYPPRRIVQVAQEFGENGMVQSICQKDLRPAIDAIVGVIAKRLRARCE